MSKKRRLITAAVVVVATIAIVIGVAIVAGIWFLRSSPERVDVSAATAVGLPNGPATKKTIGPPGGSIASSDGRITVIVPPNDLSDPVELIVTPITNQAPGGFGNAYRLEPNGQKFTTPVEISFRYTEQELKGTPEALMASYQEETGGWRIFTNERVDEAGRVLTVPTTHFTDVSLGSKFGVTSADKWDPSKYPAEASVATHFRVSPAKATIHPGESVRLDFIGCENETVMAWSERLLRRWNLQTSEYYCFRNGVGYVWNSFYVKHGTGSVYPDFGAHVLYTAPSKKPIPNVVGIQCGVMFNTGRKVKSPDLRDVQHFWQHYVQVEGVEITIVDRGYRASGQDGPTKYSGVVCSLDEPFTITGQNGLVAMPLNFVPSSGTTGTLSYTATYQTLTMSGEGTYTIEGVDTDKPRIIAQTKSTLSTMGRSSSGGGPAHINLTPIETDECSKKP